MVRAQVWARIAIFLFLQNITAVSAKLKTYCKKKCKDVLKNNANVLANTLSDVTIA